MILAAVFLFLAAACFNVAIFCHGKPRLACLAVALVEAIVGGFFLWVAWV